MKSLTDIERVATGLSDYKKHIDLLILWVFWITLPCKLFEASVIVEILLAKYNIYQITKMHLLYSLQRVKPLQTSYMISFMTS